MREGHWGWIVVGAPTNRGLSFALGALGALGLVVALPLGAGAAAEEEVTFSKDVAPILQRSCQSCHRPGSVAPMSFLTYQDVRPWIARAIKEKTARREMPPWFIEKNIGIQEFKDDPSLTDAEVATFAAWADAGAPRGDPADLPPPVEWANAEEWTIGTPDVIVSSPVMRVPAVSADYHDEFGPVPTGLTEDRYIKAVEVKEVRLAEVKEKTGGFGTFTIHHMALNCGEWVATTGAQFDRPLEERNGFRLTYELGQNATIYPADTGVVLEAGCELNFSVHLYASGEPIPVRADVGFTFHPKGYQPKYMQSGFLAAGSLGDGLDIPGGQDEVRFDGFYTLQQSGIMTTYEPHMHAAGRRMCAEAIYPDQSRDMLNCSSYNHNWARVYVYEDDVAPLLPKGTVLHVIGWYDNSPTNRNVADPRNWTGWGNRSVDTMFFLFPKMTFLTDEQFAEVQAAREAKRQSLANSQN